MRENRTYGSEGGEGDALPDPYQPKVAYGRCFISDGLQAILNRTVVGQARQ